jgi:hypothetical protein
MRDRFRQHDAYLSTHSIDSFDESLDKNPTGTETEREVGARENGMDVYPCLFKRRT